MSTYSNTNIKNSFDVAIVGSSIAGTSLALRLEKEGISVALIDKSTFPRRKPCGEGLSNIALGYLNELGLENEVLSLPHRFFSGYRVILGNKTFNIAFSNNPTEKKWGIGVERYLFDALLVKHVMKCSPVTTYYGHKVSKVIRNTSTLSLRLGENEINARFLVLADGSSSILAPRLNIPSIAKAKPRWGWSSIYEGTFNDTWGFVSILIKNGCEIYCTPVSHNRLNISVVGNKNIISGFLNADFVENFISDVIARIGFTGKRVGSALIVGPIGSCKRECFSGNVLLVGDCCESLNPIGGMGMTHALITSALASSALISVLRDGVSAEAAFANYARQKEQAIRPLRGFTRLTQMLLQDCKYGHVLSFAAKTPFPAATRAVISRETIKSLSPAGHALRAVLSLAGI